MGAEAENVGRGDCEELVALWLLGSEAGSQLVPLALQQKPRSILSKYDEELEGERPHSFRLDQGGMADGLRERELEEIRTKLRLQAQSLSTAGPRLASEYLTPEEMVSPLAAARTSRGGRSGVRSALGAPQGAVSAAWGAGCFGEVVSSRSALPRSQLMPRASHLTVSLKCRI